MKTVPEWMDELRKRHHCDERLKLDPHAPPLPIEKELVLASARDLGDIQQELLEEIYRHVQQALNAQPKS